MKEAWKPAQPKLVVGILSLAATFVFCFTAALSIDLQMIRSVDPEDYTETEVEHFAFEVTAWMDGGKIAITGWACVPNERIDDVENDIVLYLPITDEYFMIPTEMQASTQADAAVASIIAEDEALSLAFAEKDYEVEDYSYSGFYATVWPWQLDYDLSEYEICMAYRTNYYDAFLHTGVYLEVAE